MRVAIEGHGKGRRIKIGERLEAESPVVGEQADLCEIKAHQLRHRGIDEERVSRSDEHARLHGQRLQRAIAFTRDQTIEDRDQPPAAESSAVCRPRRRVQDDHVQIINHPPDGVVAVPGAGAHIKAPAEVFLGARRVLMPRSFFTTSQPLFSVVKDDLGLSSENAPATAPARRSDAKRHPEIHRRPATESRAGDAPDVPLTR